MNECYRDRNPNGGYPRNLRQNGSNRNDFDGRNRYPRDDFRDRPSRPLNTNNYSNQSNQTTQRKTSWLENNTRIDANRTKNEYQRNFSSQTSPNQRAALNNFTPMPLPPNNFANHSYGKHADQNFGMKPSQKESVRVEELSDLTKTAPN